MKKESHIKYATKWTAIVFVIGAVAAAIRGVGRNVINFSLEQNLIVIGIIFIVWISFYADSILQKRQLRKNRNKLLL